MVPIYKYILRLHLDCNINKVIIKQNKVFTQSFIKDANLRRTVYQIV